MNELLISGFFLVTLISAVLHAIPPEHDHPFRLLALRGGHPKGWALKWAATAGGFHLGTSLVLGWIGYHTGIGLLEKLGPRGLLAGAIAWSLLYSILVGAGWFTGHLQSPRTSLLRIEERRMNLLSAPALASIEGLNPCLLPWGLWVVVAPSGLTICLLLAAAWSLSVSVTAILKLQIAFPRHRKPWLGFFEKRGDFVAGVLCAGILGYAFFLIS